MTTLSASSSNGPKKENLNKARDKFVKNHVKETKEGIVRADQAAGRSPTKLDAQDEKFIKERGVLKFSGFNQPVVKDPRTGKFQNKGPVVSGGWKFT
jgi:hypothetical protein